MLDIKYIRENPDEAVKRLATRGCGDEKLIAQVLAHDETRRKLLQQVEALKAERNQSSKQVGARKSKGENADELMARGKQISDQIAVLDRQVAEVEAKQNDLLLGITNIPHSSVPVGKDDKANPILRTHGEKPKFAFEPRTHWDLGEKLGMLNLAQATKLSGAGFVLFRGEGARLERALINFLLDLHTREHGYVEISPPVIVRRECLIGTGQLPKFDIDNMYEVKDENLFLIPTAEVPVTNIHREEILAEKDLPIRYAAYTPCFRREAGSSPAKTPAA